MSDPILKHDNGSEWSRDGERFLDVVKGNRYRVSMGSALAIPDDNGPWLALVTYRGKDAPPRPEVLPVGTRVRRGPKWNPLWGGGVGVGVTTDDDPDYPDVTWADGYLGVYSRDALEVVSLPEPKPQGARDPRTVVAVFTSLTNAMTTLRLLDGTSVDWPAIRGPVPAVGSVLPEPKAAEPFVVLADPDGNHSAVWLSDGSYRDPSNLDAVAHHESTARFMRARFHQGGRYSAEGPPMTHGGWLCVRDFTGPDYREPEKPKGASEHATDAAAYANAAAKAWFRHGETYRGTSKALEEFTQAAQALAARLGERCDAQAMAAQGVSASTCRDGSVPSTATSLPDYLPPHIAAKRPRHIVVPTDLDDHLIPDAEPGWGGRR